MYTITASITSMARNNSMYGLLGRSREPRLLGMVFRRHQTVNSYSSRSDPFDGSSLFSVLQGVV
jgi:hypothetical protein